MSDQEATTSTMLRQVLANHCALHALPLCAALCGLGSLLCKIGVQCIACHLATSETFVEATVSGLQDAVRQREGTAPLPPFVAATREDDEDLTDLDAPTIVQAHTLGQVLAQLLTDAGHQQHLSVQGGWRIAVGLTADVLVMLIAQFDDDLEHVEVLITEDVREVLAGLLRDQLPGVPG